MAKNIDEKVKNDLLSCDIISIAVDESTDINNIGRLAIIIRFASINSSNVNEELCVLASVNDTTKGTDIFPQVQDFGNFKNGQVLDLKSKLLSITTDGAPSMKGKTVGFVKLMENELGRSLLSFHCIIHEENLFAKASAQQRKNVMENVVKIVNMIIARSALIHRRFKAFLEEIESKYGDLLLHSEIRWLRGKVLNRFVECFDDIQIFLHEIGENDLELNDKQWFLRLLFLTDIMNHYNDFKVRLQGNNRTILKIYEEWKSFTSKLILFETDIKTKKFHFFPLLKREHEKENIDERNLNMFETWISVIKSEYENRFQSLKKHGEMLTFIIKPDEIEENIINLKYFEYLRIDSFSLEMIDFKSSTLWTDKFKKLRNDLENTEDNHFLMISTCWASLPTRSRLTIENSDACVRLKTTNYKPDFTKLTSQVQHQGSH
ncbi:General transcription factor II-I repeat domain-containing protein 2A, partial [Stegodyphus mimosarum]